MSRAFLFRLASFGLMLSMHYVLECWSDLLDDIERDRLDAERRDRERAAQDIADWAEDLAALATEDSGPPVPDPVPCPCAQRKAARIEAARIEAAPE